MEIKQTSNSGLNSNTKWLVGGACLLIVIAIGFLANNRKDKEILQKETLVQDQQMTENKEVMKNKELAMEKPSTMMQKQSGKYADYSPGALTEATKDGGKTILFFWAPWCPFCKEANTDFLNNLSKIPDGVTVLKVNYDTEKDLKTKYGVTYQHTFVQVDAQGNQITKWNGGGVVELVNNIK